MKTVGIIAEYNPFHNGHAYQIAEAKRITDADYAVFVMSGNFVQRGTPAIWDKYTRTRAALLGGADLVFELPVVYATASAEYFAEGGVALLSALGVDALCFGSECGDIDTLMQIAGILQKESPEFKSALDASLREGLSFPLARANALSEHCKAHGIDLCLTDILNAPNNLLGIEYCKAILSLNSSLRPVTVKRNGNAYHELSVEAGVYSSASALRGLIERYLTDTSEVSDADFFSALEEQVPSGVFPVYQDALQQLPALTADDCSALLSYRLLYETAETLSRYSDWNPEFANRILSLNTIASGFDQTAASLKSRQITLTRANRMLLHMLLQITSEQLQAARSGGSAFYARLLGLREDSSKSLRQLSGSATVPVINKLAPSLKELDGIANELLLQDIRAAELYRMLQQKKVKLELPNEFTRGVVRI